ncbi:FlaA1/EpsC-like NDP-sugar epimerase [Rhodovulum bhavnagarense]|uniref:FlaA1/EpsC-like NDP-sugar epimerase n=2 Tax=Rhodovulum bhavnagarense TaxID=992286 RepID=A0A4R2RPG7_9RHOB|nr:nucleoside-diphosphate sugar epimerase/dehydratase [Rhodovulum bhavnagarense]TCP61085.1 FlaA1/EpsC-like NDP-sugar epimerase [Rhodovulum bhavnagarense]
MMKSFVKSLSRTQKKLVLLGMDLALVALALLIAAIAQENAFPGGAWFRQAVPVLATLLPSAAAISILLGIPRIQLKAYEISAMSRSAAATLALAAILGLICTLFQPLLRPGGVVVFALAFLVLTVTTRLVLLQALLAIYRDTESHCRVLIYGAGTTGMQLALALKAHNQITAVAFVDDNQVLQGTTVAGLTVHAPKELDRLLGYHSIERVLIAIPSLSPPRQAQIARRIANAGVEVQAVPSFAQLVGAETLTDSLAPVLPSSLLGREQVDSALSGIVNAYTGKNVMISGAGGSIGSELCRQILNCNPARLVLLELSEYALYNIDNELRTLAEGMNCEIVPVLGTVTDRRQVRTALEEYDVQVVLHAAAYKHVPLIEANVVAGLANNVLGTATIAQEAAAHGVERFILVSTDKAVRPVGVMGASKRLAELVVGDTARRCQAEGRGSIFAIVRFGNVLGSSGSVIPLFREQIARGGPVTLTHPDVTRYFMTVNEATQLVLCAGTMAKGGEIYVLDMGKPVKISELARRVIETSGYTVRDAANPHGDIDIAITGLRPGEKLHEQLAVGADLGRTANSKIFIAEEAAVSEFQVARALQSLRKALATGDPDLVRAEAMRWVNINLEQVQDQTKRL